MIWKDVPAGTYSAKVADFGLEEIEKLDNKIKVSILFDVLMLGGQETVAGMWEGFLETKEGKPNLKTIKTLAACGFNSTDVFDLVTKEDALDRNAEVEVQITKEVKGDKTYTRIDWVNKPGGASSSMTVKKVKPRTRPNAAFQAALADAIKGNVLKDDELPF